MTGSNFNPQTDIPDLTGKVILVTGASAGLGEATVTALAAHNPGKIYLAARSLEKADAALSRIKAVSPAHRSANIQILNLDLASMASIKKAASHINSEDDRLDIFYHNGGVAMIPQATTSDGYEVQFGTNYLSHAMLTRLLMPKMLATAKRPGSDVRIIVISTTGHKVFAPKDGILFNMLKTDMASRPGRELYGQSKLAMTLFTYELSKRYPTITSVSLHPGTVKSNIWGGDKSVNWLLNKLIVQPLVTITGVSNEEGAKTQLWATFSKNVKNGSYYEPIGKAGQQGKLSYDDELADKLWKWSEKEFEAHGVSGWDSI